VPASSAVDVTNDTSRIFGPVYRTATLGILIVITLIAFEGISIGTIMPAVSASLDAIDLYGWSFSAFLMASLFINVVAGMWADRRGHTLPFLLGVVVFVAGMVLAGTALSKGLFIVARAVQGFGAGAVVVAAYVMIARVYDTDARPKMFAALSAAWVVPSLVGPAVAGVVADTAGWRWVFFGLVPLVVPAVIMLVPALRMNTGPDGDGEDAGDDDRTGAGTTTLAAASTAGGAGALLYGVDNLHIAPAIGAGLCVCGLILLLIGCPRLLPAGALLFRRGLPTTIVMRGLFSGAFFGVNSYIPLILHDVRGFSTTAAGLAITVGAIGWSAGSYLQSKGDLDRVGLIRWGAWGVTLGVVISALAGVGTVSGWITVPAWTIAGLGMGIGISSVNVTAMSQSPDDQQGATSAALQVTDTLGASLTIGVGGALINLIGHDDLSRGYIVITLLMALVGAFATLVAGRAREAG